MATHWTEKEDELLKNIYTTNVKNEILKKINKSWATIHRRALRLKLHRNPELINEDRLKRGPRKDAWSIEEETLLKKIYENNHKEDILSKIHRPWKGIWSRAYSLGLHRNEDIVKKEMIEGGENAPPSEMSWTEEQVETLKNIYEKNLKKEILLKINKTWKAIREKACSIGLHRDIEFIKKDNVTGTSDAVFKKYGVKYTTQLECVKTKSRATNIEKRGVPYPTQDKKVRDKIKNSVQEKFGVKNVFQNDEIKEKIKQTNIERYGVENPLQNPSILQKVQETARNNNSFSISEEEIAFYEYLKEIDPFVEHQVSHPQVKFIIDYYSPKFNLWIQYDGDYWHGRNPITKTGPRVDHIIGTMGRDKIQNEQIPNLIRFWDSDIKKAIKENTVKNVILQKVLEKAEINRECHQYRKKIEFFEKDKENLGIDPALIKASDFSLSPENLTPEIVSFIKKYEWLGNIGVTPKWCFTARYKNLLSGVVLVNEPTSYSKLIGIDTPIYEALIQRGATASWTPKNLGSRLVSFACRWMVKNTKKRIFIGYADPKAHEIGTIYQACNFEYIGDKFGSSFIYRNPEIKNGNTFSAQSLKRTSSFRRWCKENNIPIQKSWIKENHFKDLSSIPGDIKQKWYTWIKNIINSSEKFPTEKKHKYVLIMWANNREKKELSSKKTYKTFSYPKRGKLNITDLQDIYEGPEKFPQILPINRNRKSVSTKSRVTPEKIDYIINNFHQKKIKEISETLEETKGWIQSQVKKLIEAGKLQPKNTLGSTKSRITKEKIDFIIANYGKIPVYQIATELKETKRWIKRQLNSIRTSRP